MKNCICCLSLLILSNLIACSGIGDLEHTEEAALEPIDTSIQLLRHMVEQTATMDSILAIAAAKKEKEQAMYLELALEKVEALKAAYDKSFEETENYVESIPFTTFLGKPAESGALEIIEFGDQYTRIYADYFDGEPIGGKLFFIQNSALIAIEVIQLKEKITENGAFIQDESTHILYYHNEALLSMIDLSTNEAVELGSIAWLDENLADWELVKAQVEIF